MLNKLSIGFYVGNVFIGYCPKTILKPIIQLSFIDWRSAASRLSNKFPASKVYFLLYN